VGLDRCDVDQQLVDVDTTSRREIGQRLVRLGEDGRRPSGTHHMDCPAVADRHRSWLDPLVLNGGQPWLATFLAALIAGKQLDDLLADAGQVDAEADEDLSGDAVALAHEAEQEVLGADEVVAELKRLALRELEDLLRSGCEGR